MKLERDDKKKTFTLTQTGLIDKIAMVTGLENSNVNRLLSQCIEHPVPVLHSRLYYSLTIRNAQDQSCSNQEQ
jgi:hypothetical protein